MVLGEPQIFGQMKDAFLVSSGIGATGPLLEPLSNTYSIAPSEFAQKQRSVDTSVRASNSDRIGSKYIQRFEMCRALLIGAGEMTEVAGQPLIDAQVQSLTIANCTPENAREMASKFNAEVILYQNYSEQLDRFDLIYSATAARLPFIG